METDAVRKSGSYGIYIKTGLSRGGFVRNVSIRDVEIIGTTKQAIAIDGFYGMVNEWCPDSTKRNPSVVDNISIANVVVRNANNSLHLHGPPELPATRVRLQNVSFGCDGSVGCWAVPKWTRACCLSAECGGGVDFTAQDITPASVLDGCHPSGGHA
jgi:hypothetical protein